VRVSGDTRGSLRASFLNIGLVEGGVRAVRSEQFSVSSKLSDCPILDHCNLVSPTSRSEPMGDPDHGLDPFPGR
jgi:hypothetical protein